jgi:hypothetical protein
LDALLLKKNQDFACVYEIAFNNYKINVNLASKSTKKKKIFLVAILKVTDDNNTIRNRFGVGTGSVRDTDPYQNVTHPQHWLRDVLFEGM